jgi:serine protease Do
MAAAILLAGLAGYTQDRDTLAPKTKSGNESDEIIIRHKGDKDSKVVVEIKNNQVFINGKPVDEYEDESISVKKLKEEMDADELMAMAPPGSPFRSRSWNFDSKDFVITDSKRAFLGVSSENAKAGGALIREITKESAAEKSGLKVGDIITKIDQSPIEDAEALTSAIRKHGPDDKVVITFKRDGKEQKVTATLGKIKEKNVETYRFVMPRVNPQIRMTPPNTIYWNDSRPRLGIRAQDTEDGKGVKVLDVDDDSPAAKAGVKEGDIITQFDGKPVSDANELVALAKAGMSKPSVKLKVTRAGKSQDLEIRVPKKLKTADL